jgi:hypothetical protein
MITTLIIGFLCLSVICAILVVAACIVGGECDKRMGYE